MAIRSSAAEYLTFVASTWESDTRFEMRYEDENIWLNLTVQTEGNRQVSRSQDHYNLQMIIAVGFKVNNQRALQFRKWAGQIVKDHTIQGWTMDVERLKKGYICPAAMNDNILHKVEYTSDPSKLYPKLVTYEGDKFSIFLGALGIHKNIHWEFQHEWRYILQFYPVNINQNPNVLPISVQVMANKILHELEKQPFPFYDLQLDDVAFSKMEITLSPKISAGCRLIVNSLIEKYNPSALTHDSSLLGLI